MTARVLCLLPLTMVAALNGQKSQLPREHVIDLVVAAAATQPAATVPLARQLTPNVTTSLTTHEPRPAPLASLEAGAPILNRTAYLIGDAFVFEVTFVNTGSAPVKFPALLGAGRIDRDMAGASVMALTLRFEDRGSANSGLETPFCDGAEPVEGSLVVVQPGERLRVRAPGRWFLGNGDGMQMAATWQRDIQLRAQLQFMKGTRYLELLSAAATPVRLAQ